MRGFLKQHTLKKALSVALSVLMAAALVLTAFPSGMKTVLADEAQVVVKLTTDATEVKAGDTLKATLSVEKNAGLASLVVRFKYDTSVLRLVSVEEANGNAFKDTVLFPVKELLADQTKTLDQAAEGLIGMAYAGANKTEAKGNILTATFEVKENAAIGEYFFGYEYLDAADAQAKDMKISGTVAGYKVAATIVVTPDTQNTEENQAAKEVVKLVEKLFEEEGEVKGVDESLAVKIKAAVSAYKEVVVEVQKEAIDESDIPKEQADLIQEKLTEERQLAACFDIDMVVKIDGEEKGNITEIASPITVSVKIPEDLPPLEEGSIRIYFVLRYHDGKVEELPATVSGDTITFKTDKFSPYVLGYEDSKGQMGDVNGDAEVDIADALMISRLDAGLIEMDAEKKKLGDVNKDGETDIADALMISRLDAGLISGF